MRAALAALAVVAVAVAATAGSVAAAAEDPIEFGYLNALTGPYAVAGVPELNGIRLGVAHVNAAGGVCNRQLRLAATEDDQGQPNLSTAGLRKLVQQEGLKIVIGPGITPPALATAPLAESLKVFYMVEVAQRDPWKGRNYVFSNISPQDVYAPLMVNYLAKRMGKGAKRVGILYSNVPYGQFGFNLLKPLVQKRGWQLSVVDNWDVTAFDFTSQAQKVANGRLDGLLLWGAATPADAKILQQVREAGYSGPAVGEVAYSLPFIPTTAGNAVAASLVAFSQLDTISPDAKTRRFLTEYKKRYKSEPTFLPAGAYDAVHVLAAAVRRAGCKDDPDSLVKAMNGLRYKGVTGQFAYTKDYKSGPQASAFRPVTFKNGKYAPAP
jgi:branched-chain amino acid transport system substrate-binding protein